MQTQPRALLLLYVKNKLTTSTVLQKRLTTFGYMNAPFSTDVITFMDPVKVELDGITCNN